MSLRTWLDEFYLVPADWVADNGTTEQIIEHSLRKWEGAKRENLVRHGLVRYGQRMQEIREDYDQDSHSFLFDAGSCSLCAAFTVFGSGDGCFRCPLFKARGGVSCDGLRHDEEESPYHNPDPGQMIFWLRTTLDMHKEGKL